MNYLRLWRRFLSQLELDDDEEELQLELELELEQELELDDELLEEEWWRRRRREHLEEELELQDLRLFLHLRMHKATFSVPAHATVIEPGPSHFFLGAVRTRWPR